MLFHMMDLLEAEVDKDMAKEHQICEACNGTGKMVLGAYPRRWETVCTSCRGFGVSPAPHSEPQTAETLSPAAPIAENINGTPDAEGGKEC